ncbi:translation initiation factor eIF2 gamma subunit [Phellopilus nigrolimitatus]|nr:translation initiation factor eIF2 gamma subunit [Phellopilus nigrolimitatus]
MMSRMEEEETETVEIDPTKLSPLSPEVISKQAIINFETAGTIGHVVHRKSAVVKAISGVMIVRFKNELVRNITIKLGYVNAKGWYRSYHFDKEDRPPCEHPGCGQHMELLRCVSFVDLSGHDILVAIMLNSAAVMDTALLFITGMNRLDQGGTALGHQKGITVFVKGAHRGGGAAHRPISAQLKYNIDAVNEYIIKWILIPVRDFTSSLRSIVVHSFDVNKPSAEVDGLMGGVAGCSILTGVLMLGRHEIHPGIVTKDQQGCNRCCQIFSRIVMLHTENSQLLFALPSGLIGAFGVVGKLPQIYIELEISLFLLWCLLGVSKKTTKVTKLVKNELLLINIGSMLFGACVLIVKVDLKMLARPLPAPRYPALRWGRLHIGCSIHGTYIMAWLGARQGHRHTYSALLRSSTFHMFLLSYLMFYI